MTTALAFVASLSLCLSPYRHYLDYIEQKNWASFTFNTKFPKRQRINKKKIVQQDSHTHKGARDKNRFWFLRERERKIHLALALLGKRWTTEEWGSQSKELEKGKENELGDEHQNPQKESLNWEARFESQSTIWLPLSLYSISYILSILI